MSGLWFFRCCAVRIMWEMRAIVNSITQMFFFFTVLFASSSMIWLGSSKLRAQECYATTTSALEQNDNSLKARTFLICSICAVAGMIVWLRSRATRIRKGFTWTKRSGRRNGNIPFFVFKLQFLQETCFQRHISVLMVRHRHRNVLNSINPPRRRNSCLFL